MGLLRIARALRHPEIVFHLLDFLGGDIPGNGQIEKDHSPTARFGTGRLMKHVMPAPLCVQHVPRSYYRYGLPEDCLRQRLRSLPRPDLILVSSGMTYWYPGIEQTIALLRQEISDCPIIVGGIYATLASVHARRHLHADHIVSGDGIGWLRHYLEEHFSLAWMTPSATAILPEVHLLAGRMAAPLITSRGCPFHCTYCASRLLEPQYLQISASRVIDYMRECVQQYNIRDFAVYDDALLVNADTHAKTLLRALIESKMRVRIHTPNGLHARYIDEEIAGLMKQAGFETVRLSFESRQPGIQRKSSGKVSNQDLTKALRHLRRAGFVPGQIGVYTMLGLPGQSEKDVQGDIEWVHGLGARVYLASCALVPGTREWDLARVGGIIGRHTDLLQLSHTVFPVTQGGFTWQGIHRLRHRARLANQAIG